MKKSVVLIAFLLVMSVAMFAVQANVVTSYNPDVRIDNPTQNVLGEMKVRAAAGIATRHELDALEASTQNVYVAPLLHSRDSLQAGPQAADYWTGTTDGTTRTETSLAHCEGYVGTQGWFMFDLSGLPAGATVTGVTLNGYINNTVTYSYWSLTPLSCDPRTADISVLYDDIEAEASTGYYGYYEDAAVGATSLPLVGNVAADCQAAASQGWFPIGLCSRDWTYSGYHVIFDGWNEANPPYLTISYDPPPVEPTLASGEVDLTTGNTNTTFTYSVQFLNLGTGNAPSTANVVIDGTPHAMTFPGGTPDYTGWQTFTYSTTLSEGLHDYYFEFIADATTVIFPDTAPTTPLEGPEVYLPYSGTLVIDAAGGGDFTTFQDCFDALVLHGTDGNPLNIEVTAGTYVEEATLEGTIQGANETNMVHIYPQNGDVIVDGSAAAVWSGIYLLTTAHVWVDGIDFMGGQQGGLRAEDSDNIKVSYCKAYDTNWVGFGFSGCTNCSIWNCMSSNNGTQGIGFYSSLAGSNHKAWNNSIYQYGSSNGEFAMCFTIEGADIEVFNNAMYRDVVDYPNYGVLLFNQTSANYPNTVIDYNSYYDANGDNPVYGYATLADWQAAESQDMHSVYGDPNFNDPTNNDLHISGPLADASAAYQNGTDSGAWFTDDHDGDARVTPWDIGADVIVPPAMPLLTDGAVSPENGLDSDTYTWTVDFWHPSGTAPNNVKVYIDGNMFGTDMTLTSGVAGNGTYTYSGTLGGGNHNFYFSTSTDLGSVRLPETGTISGPGVTEISVPYVQDFESGAMPAGWIQEYVNLEKDWTFQTGNYGTNEAHPDHAYEGTYNASLYGSSSRTAETLLITPMFDLTPLAMPALSFWHTQAAWSGDQDELSILYKTSAEGDWNVLAIYTESTPDWTQRVLPLPDPTATYWIAFDGWTNFGYGIGVDYVEINEASEYLVAIPAAPQSEQAIIGESYIYNVPVYNGGTMSDTYDLTVEGNDWDVTLWDTPTGTRSQITDTGVVASGDVFDVYVKVTVPETAAPEDIDELTFTAKSQADPTRMAITWIATEAYESYNCNTSIDTEEQAADPGTTVTYTVTINNTGGLADTYDLSVADNAWTTAWVDAPSVTISSGDTYDAEVTVTIDGSGGESDTAVLTVTSQGDNTLVFDHTITTTAIPHNGEGYGFFYTWADSHAPSGPVYSWVTHNTPTEILPLPTDDQEIGPYPIGFEFEFYGKKFDEIYFGANGAFNFDGSNVNYTNYEIPYTTATELIAWFWNDLDPDDHVDTEAPDTHIYYETLTVDGMNALVFTMTDYYQLNGIGNLTAQVILYSNGNIKFQYMSFDDTIIMNSSTVGIQNGSGNDGVLYEYNENRLAAEMAIMFYYTPMNFTHSEDGANFMLDWDAVAGAESYNVYSSTDPFADPTTWTLETNTTATEYSEALVAGKYYAVTCYKADPIAVRTRLVERENNESKKERK